MRNLMLMAMAAVSLFSAGCLVRVRERPVAHYRRVGPPPPPPRYYDGRVYYDHRDYRDDRGYRYYR